MSNDFDDDDLVLIRLITRVLSAISITSLLLCVFTYLYFKKIRTFALELIIWLCISNIIFYIGYFLPIDDDGYCITGGILYMSMDKSSIIWVTIIVYTAYKSLITQNYLEKNRNYYRILFFLIADVFPIVLALGYIIIK
jgi:hypothetical protein